MEIKNKKAVFIGTDGKPEANADGSLIVNDIFHGFTDEASFTAIEQERLKVVAEKEQELINFKKNLEIEKVIAEANIEPEFWDLIKLKIDNSKDIQNIKNDINDLAMAMPKIKKTVNTGGIGVTKTTLQNATVKKDTNYSAEAKNPNELLHRKKGK